MINYLKTISRLTSSDLDLDITRWPIIGTQTTILKTLFAKDEEVLLIPCELRIPDLFT